MPRVTLTPEQAAAYFAGLPTALETQMGRATLHSLDLLRDRAEAYSSGPWSLAALARAGHPYSRRRPQRGRFNPAIINRQSGAFARAWQTVGPTSGGDGFSGAVFNVDPKADLLARGTRLMVARPLPQAVVTETRREVRALYADALVQAFRI